MGLLFTKLGGFISAIYLTSGFINIKKVTKAYYATEPAKREEDGGKRGKETAGDKNAALKMT